MALQATHKHLQDRIIVLYLGWVSLKSYKRNDPWKEATKEKPDNGSVAISK